MKIFIVSQVYYPEKFRINEISAELVKRGHEVTVLAGLPDTDLNWHIPKEYKHGRRRKEEHNGVNIIRVQSFARRRNPISLSLNYLSFAFNGFMYCAFHHMEYDVIYVYELTPVTMIWPAIKAKKKCAAKLLCYCLDIWPECVKVYGISDKNIVFPILSRVSKYLYQQCDQIAVTSRPFFKYLNKVNKIPYNKMIYLPQDADEELMLQDFSVEDNGIVDFVYVGNIGMAQNIECILLAVEQIHTNIPYKVHFVGAGYELDKCQNIVKEKGLENKVEFYGSAYGDELLSFYKLADACLLTLKYENFVGLTMPAKLQSYMAAGKAIIGSISGAALEIIEEADCGKCVEANDCDGLAEIMTDFIENPERYEHCGENARKYFKENFSKKKHVDTLETLLTELSEQKKSKKKEERRQNV